jgi:predicted RNA-binding protein with EMAP domain
MHPKLWLSEVQPDNAEGDLVHNMTFLRQRNEAFFACLPPQEWCWAVFSGMEQGYSLFSLVQIVSGAAVSAEERHLSLQLPVLEWRLASSAQC